MNSYYDSRLFIYQALLEIPAQVLMLDLYDKLDDLSKAKYPIMSTVNLGSSLLTLMAAKALYSTIHSSFIPDKGSRFYISPTSKYLYDKVQDDIINSPSRVIDQKAKNLEFILDSSDAYSENYYNLTYGYLGSKFAYSFMESSQIQNPLLRSLYALSQPLSVILKDNGKL